MSGRRPPRLVVAAVVLTVAVTAVWFGFLKDDRTSTGLTASGTVEATEGQLAFQAAGRVLEVSVREGDRVIAGQRLASLDRSELDARRAQLVAQLMVARAGLAELRSGFRDEEVAQGRAGLRAAEAQVADAERDIERARLLHAGGAVSEEALEKSALALSLARLRADERREMVHILESGPRPERLDAQAAQVAAAEAGIQAVDATLSFATITAPFAGVITVRHREPGETAPPGAPVLTLMNPDDRWVRIYVQEDRIGRVALGQAATITSDSYPDRPHEGRVTFISSEAEFTPRNVQTPEERVKLVYAVKVQVVADSGFELKPGMPADVLLVEEQGAL
jgi:HlyD family secretion protein